MDITKKKIMKSNNNWGRTFIAQDTLAILKTGVYHHESAGEVSLQAMLDQTVSHTDLFTPDDLKALIVELPVCTGCHIEMVNETTLVGAERLTASREFERIGVLNFASAKNPGGGFQRGAHAQEESLARSSALYLSLQQCPAYYEYHKKNKSLLYSDHMIYSADCPVFKRDNGELLETPYQVDFITSPAPNRGAIARKEMASLEQIDTVFARRIRYVLTLAAYKGCDALVLGAWGCGVFGNRPERVARLFADVLTGSGEFVNTFRHISFSVPENPRVAANTAAFKQYFL